ncbi:hypothetical protein M9194_06630 [Vibrio sp. S4M6]|uniref:hypothetical protein n=1 Tax=Vibrio sinus TaxID=2946865 RepID=UPI00202A5AA6|nr:hypothetical protein [Vibrio sinus]MCL9781099.1 hypothetical protein [Vibrio sinus]
MAYLPFYITPEKFQEYQQQRVKSVEYTPDVTRWMCKNVEHNYRFFRAIFWVIPILVTAIIFGGIMTFGSSRPVWYISNPDIYFLIVPLIIGGWAAYLSYGIDDRYDYTLSSSGIIYKKRLDEPLWGPRFVQIMAYFGCIGCLLAIIIAGPMVLVGSGGFLLLAFISTKKREIYVDEHIIPSEQFLCVRHHKKRKVFCLYSKYDVCEESLEQPESVFRVHTKEDSCLFYKSKQQFTAIKQILTGLNIPYEDVDDIKLIFDFNQAPECFYELPMASETFHRDEALTRFNDPPPSGKSQEQVNKETEELFGNI